MHDSFGVKPGLFEYSQIIFSQNKKRALSPFYFGATTTIKFNKFIHISVFINSYQTML